MRAGCRLLRTGLLAALGTLICLGAQLAGAAAPLAAPVAPHPPAQAGPAVKQVCARPVRPGYAACNAVQRTDAAARRRSATPDAAPPGYGPADLQSAYRLPAAAGGTGQTVAIIDAYDDPSAESDLAVYRAQYGLPPCTTANGCFGKVDQRGGTIYPLPRWDWAAEISLDLDMVSAACPNCHILLVEAEDPSILNLGTAVNTAVRLGAKFVSNSYGAAEDPAETTWDAGYYHHDGVVVTASTGDFGYGVEYPAASQFVTAVGGTSLVRDAGSSRGWAETAWDGAGSGCSAYEAKPSWQHDTGCAFKAEADVSAVADPATGVAVYDTFQATGWDVYGGTSAAAPLIAATYALAGAPVAGSNPAAYPYANPAAVNDVTSGSNGSCDPDYLCTAGPGFDGPTGLGTPDGPGAFAMVEHGTVAGTVTDAGSGAGIGGVQLEIDRQTTTTDASGHYQLSVPVGTFDLTATKFGYASRTVAGVRVTADATTAADVALSAEPTTTITGTITDGTSHHWPLAARITVPGTPAVATSDPATGKYSLTVLRGQSYTLHVDAHYPGYAALDQPVDADGPSQQQDFAVPVDATTCGAPGYRFDFAGDTEAFDGSTTPAGWTVVHNSGDAGWRFDDGNPNNTGGSGGFAAADAAADGAEDTDLISPVADLSAATTPIVQFHSHLQGSFNSTATVDVSLDGGQSWTNAWRSSGYPGVPGPGLTVVALPQAAGQAAVQVRFHLDGSYALWQVDDVFVGNRSCDALPGGLLAGHVTDQNTGAALAGATVADATSEPDGFYALFAPSGGQQVTAAQTHYASVPRTVDVAADAVTTADFTLPAGRLALDHQSVTGTAGMGSTTTATVTITNTGSAPATARLTEAPGAFNPQARSAGAPTRVVRASIDLGPHHPSRGSAATAKAAGVAGAAWTPLAGYPTPIMDEALVTDPVSGKVYSFGGFDGSADTAASYVYDPGSQAWTPIAPMRVAREHASAAWINGRVYVTGGWAPTGDTVARTEIYDPATNTWSRGADVPTPLAASGIAVHNARLYIVGGCDPVKCDHTDVQVYDPAADRWSTAAAYAEPASWLACGAVYGQIYCAGGQTLTGSTTDAFAYDPATDAWSRIASLPIDLAAMSYAVANDRLLVVGGATGQLQKLTNQGFAYDPDTDAWTALPNANVAVYRAGGACGLYTVGGSTGGSTPTDVAEQLAGFAGCNGNFDVGWLSTSTSTVTLDPGQHATVTLTFHGDDPSITQPGTYAAELGVNTDTPYATPPIDVALTTTPPKTWGKITGTVLARNCDGSTSPIAGATVEVDSSAAGYALTTDASGHYGLWLDRRNNPLTVIASAGGMQPRTATARIKAGQATTLDLTLTPLRSCS